MSHPVDGKAWKHFDDKYNWFAKDARNLRVKLHKHHHKATSWPGCKSPNPAWLQIPPAAHATLPLQPMPTSVEK